MKIYNAKKINESNLLKSFIFASQINKEFLKIANLNVNLIDFELINKVFFQGNISSINISNNEINHGQKEFSVIVNLLNFKSEISKKPIFFIDLKEREITNKQNEFTVTFAELLSSSFAFIFKEKITKLNLESFEINGIMLNYESLANDILDSEIAISYFN